MPVPFHETRFPTAIAFGSSGGPERRTDIVTLYSGAEERNSRWADSRRSYDAGYGIRSLDDLHAVIAFFEERRGRLYGFRWKDRADWKSCAPGATPAATDQAIGIGDGATTAFQLVKTYGAAHAPWTRAIRKPVAGTVLVALDGTPQAAGWSVDDDHRRRYLRRGAGRRRGDHRRLRVRRAGALRYRQARDQPVALRGGRDPGGAAGGNPAVGIIGSRQRVRVETTRIADCPLPIPYPGTALSCAPSLPASPRTSRRGSPPCATAGR